VSGEGAKGPSLDPWSWLLGRTASGGWRHAPFRALDPGQGQDPSLEPRVEVVRRLIAYPARAFAGLIAAIAASDTDPRRPIQWVCHRSSGEAPARSYWLSFLRAKEPSGRRFYAAIELFDRDRVGLWFLSGFQDKAVPRTARAPFPDQPRVSLPRFEIGQDSTLPYGRWIALAFEDALVSFAGTGEDPSDHPTALEGPLAGRADFVDQSIVLDTIPPPRTAQPSAGNLPTLLPDEPPPSIRSARARLLVRAPGRAPEIFPLARLTTTIGRDPRCDIVVDDRSVSSEHARIVFREGTPTIEDLGSKNGTRVGAAAAPRGEPRALEAETFLALGHVSALFVQDADEPAGPGEKRAPRQRARLEELVQRGRLPRAAADRALTEAAARGLTPAEVLLQESKLTPEDWTGVAPRSQGSGCLVGLVLACLLAVTGCHSFGIPPFYEQAIDEGVPMREGEREVTWDEDIGLGPLFNVRHAEKDDRTEVNWLFPFGLYERKGEDKRVHVYPFYLRDVRVDPDGFKHDTTIVFPPGLFAGTHPIHGDFCYLFPFGGSMYGLLGKDEIKGVLFPLFAWTKDRGVETTHILFPLVAWWQGGDEKATQTGFRVLPFYGHQEKVTNEGVKVFDRTTVLWPFITWVTEAKNSRNPLESIFIFPFWGRTRSDWRDEDTILWPLFRYMHDKTTHYEEWRAPFPFFFYGQPDGSKDAVANSRFDIWPFFGVRVRGDSYFRQFVAWPFERYERQETDEYTDRRFWFVPFVYTKLREGKDPKQPWTERKTRLWPLVRYERKKDGDLEVHALCPLWFDDPLENFDTLMDPLYRVFRYVSHRDGSSELDLLLGAFSTRTKKDGSSRWDVLGGLVGHGATPAGPDKLRVLWLLDL
jgi:hypothetical protein